MDAPKKNRRICVGGKRPSGLRLVSAPGMREHRLGTGRFQRREEPRTHSEAWHRPPRPGPVPRESPDGLRTAEQMFVWEAGRARHLS